MQLALQDPGERPQRRGQRDVAGTKQPRATSGRLHTHGRSSLATRTSHSDLSVTPGRSGRLCTPKRRLPLLDDVPGILRAIADGDEETAKEAASELFGNIWHQGTVCLALADVLARTAADPEAGLDAISLLRQLGPVPDAADAIFAVADRTGPERTADEALACLLEWGDLRAEIRRFLANSEKFSGARPE